MKRKSDNDYPVTMTTCEQHKQIDFLLPKLCLIFKMPDMGERTLCSERIFVPPSFPSIMKGYCKAAIRTQPYDLLRWSAAYFRALANGENPPVKERLEFPSSALPPGLTPGYLKVLVNQLGKDPEKMIDCDTVEQKWTALCLPPDHLDPLLLLLGGPKFHWLRFLAVAAGSISSSLSQTMILICELLTDEPDGGAASIPVEIFTDLYQYLAYLDCGSVDSQKEPEIKEDKLSEISSDPRGTTENTIIFNQSPSHPVGETTEGGISGFHFPGIGPPLHKVQVAKVVEYMETWANRQDGKVMPRNIRHWMCPPLDQIIPSEP